MTNTSISLFSWILVLGSILLILQEEFLVERVPFTLFYSFKLFLKVLTLRSRFEAKHSFKDFSFIWLACFGKKTIIDIAYYHINLLRYVQYTAILIAIDLTLTWLRTKGVKHEAILSIKPLKVFLQLASGITDAISLENLLWRNQINGWHLDAAVFFFVVLDPLFYTVFAWYFQNQKIEKNFAACQKSLNFGVFFSISHYIFSLEGYMTLIKLRRKIPFSSSNVMTFAVGMRLLNSFSYVLLVVYDMIMESQKEAGKPEVCYNFEEYRVKLSQKKQKGMKVFYDIKSKLALSSHRRKLKKD